MGVERSEKRDLQLVLKPGFTSPEHAVLVVVLDGVGIGPSWKASHETAVNKGDAVAAAYMPNLRFLMQQDLSRTLIAHGPQVGLPSSDDMGNSEVGHNALGSGQIIAQGAKLVNQALFSGQLFQGTGWKTLVQRPEMRDGRATLHLCGLLSDGNVHSHIDHLFSLIRGAKEDGVKKIRLHLLLDGRDVGPRTALDYVKRLEEFLASIRGDEAFSCEVASGGGRMKVTMDRYGSDWSIVERGYAAHVLGQGELFLNLGQAVETLRARLDVGDQDLPPFVIGKNGQPCGVVRDGDSFIFFNFRGDRAIEFCQAMTDENFTHFDRKIWPKVFFAGMMQYDGDLKLPELYLVEPPVINGTLTERLSATQVKQFACSETQKFGHVTYFWNGNRSGKFDPSLELEIEIPSDKGDFDKKPWMKALEITEVTMRQMESHAFRVGRINFANGDMVGHTGDFHSAVASLTIVDQCLGRLMECALKTQTVLIVVADHGNADEMYELDKSKTSPAKDDQGRVKVKTSHTLSPVPFCVFNLKATRREGKLRPGLESAGLANVAATVLEILGFVPPIEYEKSLVELN